MASLEKMLARHASDAPALRRLRGGDHVIARTARNTACKVARSAPGGTRIVVAPITISIMGTALPPGGGSSLPIGAFITGATVGVDTRLAPSSRPAWRS